MTNPVFKRLPEILERDKRLNSLHLTRINKGEIVGSSIHFLMLHHVNKLFYLRYIGSNIPHVLSECFTCGLLSELLIEKIDYRILGYDLAFEHFSYVLLSNNSKLIDRYSKLRHSEFDFDLNKGNLAPILIIQSILRNDYDNIERGFKIMSDRLILKRPTLKIDYQILQAIVESDLEKFRDGISKILSKNVSGRRNTGIQHYFYSHASCYLKLAKHMDLDIDIEIENDKVPIELINFDQQLKYSIPYEFILKLNPNLQV